MVEGHPAYDFELAVERVKAAASAARGLGRPFVFCARADGLMNGVYGLDEALKRIAAFAEAGRTFFTCRSAGPRCAAAVVAAAGGKPSMPLRRGRSGP